MHHKLTWEIAEEIAEEIALRSIKRSLKRIVQRSLKKSPKSLLYQFLQWNPKRSIQWCLERSLDRSQHLLTTSLSFPAIHKHRAARVNAVASRNTNGIDCLPTIPTTIARASSWIGSCFLHAVFVDVIPERSADRDNKRERDVLQNATECILVEPKFRPNLKSYF